MEHIKKINLKNKAHLSNLFEKYGVKKVLTIYFLSISNKELEEHLKIYEEAKASFLNHLRENDLSTFLEYKIHFMEFETEILLKSYGLVKFVVHLN